MNSSSIGMAPFSQDAEEAVIGSVLIGRMDVYPALSAFLKAEDFYLLRNRYIWEAFTRIADRNGIMDLTTIGEELRTHIMDHKTKRSALEDIGGPAYLLQLINNTPNSMHAEAYGRLVEKTSSRRAILQAKDKMADLAMNEGNDIDDVLDRTISALLAIKSRHVPQNGAWLKDLVEEHYADFERRLTLPDDEPESVLFTGYQDLDSLMGPLEPGRLIVFAGRPGMGKTAKLLNIIYQMARRGIGASFNTMEMNKKQIMDRLLALDSAVSSSLQKRAKELTKEEQRKILAAYGRLADLPIYLDPAPRPSPREIMSKSEWLVRQHGVQVIGVDGIYLMRSDYNFNGNKVEEVGQISRGLKEIAATLEVPVLTTHQLNRSLESRLRSCPCSNSRRAE